MGERQLLGERWEVREDERCHLGVACPRTARGRRRRVRDHRIVSRLIYMPWNDELGLVVPQVWHLPPCLPLELRGDHDPKRLLTTHKITHRLRIPPRIDSLTPTRQPVGPHQFCNSSLISARHWIGPLSSARVVLVVEPAAIATRLKHHLLLDERTDCERLTAGDGLVPPTHGERNVVSVAWRGWSDHFEFECADDALEEVDAAYRDHLVPKRPRRRQLVNLRAASTAEERHEGRVPWRELLDDASHLGVEVGARLSAVVESHSIVLAQVPRALLVTEEGTGARKGSNLRHDVHVPAVRWEAVLGRSCEHCVDWARRRRRTTLRRAHLVTSQRGHRQHAQRHLSGEAADKRPNV